MTLFEMGDFTLASGAHSDWKIECDALSPADWKALAAMLAEHVGVFGMVVGVPRGGIPLQHAMERYATGRTDDPILFVDDVWTTGGSMQRFIESYLAERDLPGDLSQNPLKRAVIFARGRLTHNTIALFAMPQAQAETRF